MSEAKCRKAIFICRVVAVISAFILLILMASMASGSMGWVYGGGGRLIKGVYYVLSAGVFAPPFIILFLRMKLESQKTEGRIKELEKEVERLKKNR